ncbi:MAG: hypothetical protein JW715_02680, partial [Sedimentisphaerales bacterium]|nr:hypothetical protein [Sedimentisphaerales bacterium]
MKKTKYKLTNLLMRRFFAAILFFAATSAFASGSITPILLESMQAVPESASIESGSVSRVFDLIYQGKFDDASKLFKEYSDESPGLLGSAAGHLSEIIGEYHDITQQMKQGRDKAYSEKLTELNKLKDKNDVNDVNDIIEVLSAVANVNELA